MDPWPRSPKWFGTIWMRECLTYFPNETNFSQTQFSSCHVTWTLSLLQVCGKRLSPWKEKWKKWRLKKPDKSSIREAILQMRARVTEWGLKWLKWLQHSAVPFPGHCWMSTRAQINSGARDQNGWNLFKALCSVQKTLRFGSVWLHNTRFTVDRDRVAIARHVAISRFLVPGPVSQCDVPLKLLKAHVWYTVYTVYCTCQSSRVHSTDSAGFRGFFPCSDSQNWEPKAVGHRVTPVEMELLLPRAAEDPVDTKQKLLSWGAGESMGMRNAKTLYPCSSHQNSWDLWMWITH